MFILESTSPSGIVMRQTLRSCQSMMPILRARTAVELKGHNNIKLMNDHGHAVLDISYEFENNTNPLRIAEPKKPKLRAVA